MVCYFNCLYFFLKLLIIESMYILQIQLTYSSKCITGVYYRVVALLIQRRELQHTSVVVGSVNLHFIRILSSPRNPNEASLYSLPLFISLSLSPSASLHTWLLDCFICWPLECKFFFNKFYLRTSRYVHR